MHNAGGKKHERTKVHVACGNRNQQLFVVDIFLCCFFFLLHWNCGSFLFFHAFRVFSPFAACLGGKVPKHHKISLSTATLSRVSMCLCAWSLYTAIWWSLMYYRRGALMWVYLKKEYSQVLSIRDRKNDVYFIANNPQQPAHIFTSISVKQEMCTSELERKKTWKLHAHFFWAVLFFWSVLRRGNNKLLHQ